MKFNLAFAVVAPFLAVMPLFAHHSVEGQYDTDKMLTIRGMVMKIEWVNRMLVFGWTRTIPMELSLPG